MQETFGNVRKENCSLDLRGHWLINLNDKSLVCANVCMSVWQQVLFLTSSKKLLFIQYTREMERILEIQPLIGLWQCSTIDSNLEVTLIYMLTCLLKLDT